MNSYQNFKHTKYDCNALSDVLARAFIQDPWLVKLFSGQLKYTTVFFEFVLKYCTLCGGSVLMLEHNARLAAVACLENPSIQLSFFSGIQLLWASLKLLLTVGPRTMGLINTYMKLTIKHRPKENHHYLICIGVLPEFQGLGLGKDLLQEIHNIVDADPTSVGIGLDTENVSNVGLYEHLGYSLTGEEAIDGLAIYTMFRKKN